MSGYARAHRGRWEHPLFKNKQEAAVWAWMTDTARFRPHSFQTRFGVVQLERGQLLASQRTIAEDFGLGRQQVRRLVDSMVIAGMITENSTHSASRAGTIITIVNYERYQGFGDADQDAATQRQPKRQPITNPRPTQDQPTREEREKREEREEGSPSDSLLGTPSNAPPGELVLLPATSSNEEVRAAFDAYDALRREFVPGARSIAFDADRRKRLAACLRTTGGIAGWAAVLSRIRASAFLRGETSRRGFVAEFDWLTKPANLRKVQEGNYDDDHSTTDGAHHPRGRAGVPASPIDAFGIAIAAAGLG